MDNDILGRNFQGRIAHDEWQVGQKARNDNSVLSMDYLIYGPKMFWDHNEIMSWNLQAGIARNWWLSWTKIMNHQQCAKFGLLNFRVQNCLRSQKTINNEILTRNFKSELPAIED